MLVMKKSPAMYERLTPNHLPYYNSFFHSMNRIQFWILNGLAGLLIVLFILQIVLVRSAIYEQNQVALAQQALQQGQAFQGNLKQLAMRIVQVSQQTNDQGLKDILARQQITFTPQGADTNGASAPAPAAH